MSDPIDRQAAIDALAKFVPYAICDESTESYTNGLMDAYNLILQLPSAQPEQCSDCIANGGDWECDHMHCRKGRLPSVQPKITLESAIDYLHSIGWMQTHDRILTESAQPERKKGKWIHHTDWEYDGECAYECSVCGMGSDVDYDFCMRCGADMRTSE